MTKGQIWISAVLYLALGIIILTIVLAAGTPVINNMKDKYTLTQTKEIMVTLDDNIRTVYNEGPGSQRPVKLKIGKGEFIIDDEYDNITWTFTTSFQVSELDTKINEDNLGIVTIDTGIEDQYETTLSLDYNGTLDLNYSATTATLSGSHRLLITNIGGDPLQIKITEL